ncbi:MAG TPA: hypothetical protein VKE51_34135 [Vicinamibacterales bacterium]|nr:hypothetical protein [Vicinamibacterales bacterium]
MCQATFRPTESLQRDDITTNLVVRLVDNTHAACADAPQHGKALSTGELCDAFLYEIVEGALNEQA